MDRTPAEAVVLMRFVVVRVEGATGPPWQPAFGRIDLALTGHAPQVVADDLGRVRVLVETIPVSDFRTRLTESLSGTPFSCAGVAVTAKGLEEKWSHTWLSSAASADWGVTWPCDVAAYRLGFTPRIHDLLEGSHYGTVRGSLAIIARTCGFRTYYGTNDARNGTIQLFAWDYRGRIRRAWQVPGSVCAHVDPRENPILRLRGMIGTTTLPSVTRPSRNEWVVDTSCAAADFELVAGETLLDNRKADLRMTEPLLPGGVPIPTGDSLALLLSFDRRPPFTTPPSGRSKLIEVLVLARKQDVSTTEFDHALSDLLDLGLVEEVPHPGPAVRLPALPSLPRLPKLKVIAPPGYPQDGEQCFATTHLGAKAARLATTREHPLVARAGWKLGLERLTDQVILACEIGGVKGDDIDAACCLAPTPAVMAAIERVRTQGFLDAGDNGRWSLTLRGKAKLAELLVEMSPTSHSDAGPNQGEPSPIRTHNASTRPVTSSDNPIPAELRERFACVEEIGSGGFAVVYLVREVEQVVYRALKIPNRGREAQARAQREAQAAAELQHPNILRVLEYDPAGKWFLFPQAERTLGQWSQYEGLSDRAVVDVVRQLGAALQHAHERGFLHRDLHGDNVLRVDGRWVVADWGMTITTHHDNLTRTHTGGGNGWWIAPEQRTRLRSATERSDLYSLGRIAQWLVAGPVLDVVSPGVLPVGHALAAFVSAATIEESTARPVSVREAMELISATSEGDFVRGEDRSSWEGDRHTLHADEVEQ